MQLLHKYYINYDLWDMTGDMHALHGPSTSVMETSLKYYIGTVGKSQTLCHAVVRRHPAYGFGLALPM